MREEKSQMIQGVRNTYPTGMGRNSVVKDGEESGLQYSVYSTVYIKSSFFLCRLSQPFLPPVAFTTQEGIVLERQNKKLKTEGSVGVRGFMCALVSKLWPEKRYLR